MAARILITGGEGRLGQALAEQFRREPCEVLAPGRDELDVSDPACVDDYFSSIDSLDLLVANAGWPAEGLLARLGPVDWDRSMEVNLHGAARCARAAFDRMRRARSGHLLFVSSQAAIHPAAGQAAYAAAKAGLLGLMRSLAREGGGFGIRANAVLPGFLESPMTAGVPDGHREAVRDDHVLGRFNTPERVAGLVRHLHFELPHTSGQVFQLDSRVG